MGHTPGPWSADYGDFAAYCDTGAEVCEVTRGRRDDGSRIPDDEMEANLNLVAAAPELLEALIAAKGTIEYLLANSDNGPAENCIAIIASAIAKAEGRTE